VWPDIVELAGGTAGLLERARSHAQGGRPLQALHLTDIILSQAPDDRAASTVKHAALQQLLAAAGGENHSEMQWLQQELNAAKADEEKQ
jgi:Alkyl sulfatase dimerisation